VPQLHGSTVAHDRPALLLAWCQGRTLLEELRMRPWQVWRPRRVACTRGYAQCLSPTHWLVSSLRGLLGTMTQTQRYAGCNARLVVIYRQSCTWIITR
jgi:hypothetical protein